MARWHALSLWLVAVVLGIAVIPLVAYSGHLYYAEGGQSPDAPGMLLVLLVMTAPVWLGGWLAFVACFLVGYRGGATLRPFWGGASRRCCSR